MKNVFLSLLIIGTLIAPMGVAAQGNTPAGADISACKNISSTGVAGIVNCLIGFFNIAIYILMSAAVVYVVYGAFKMIGEEGREAGKAIVMYGIIGLFVMVSIWGFVNILNNTFNLTGSPIDPPKLTK